MMYLTWANVAMQFENDLCVQNRIGPIHQTWRVFNWCETLWNHGGMTTFVDQKVPPEVEKVVERVFWKGLAGSENNATCRNNILKIKCLYLWSFETSYSFVDFSTSVERGIWMVTMWETPWVGKNNSQMIKTKQDWEKRNTTFAAKPRHKTPPLGVRLRNHSHGRTANFTNAAALHIHDIVFIFALGISWRSETEVTFGEPNCIVHFPVKTPPRIECSHPHSHPGQPQAQTIEIAKQTAKTKTRRGLFHALLGTCSSVCQQDEESELAMSISISIALKAWHAKRHRKTNATRNVEASTDSLQIPAVAFGGNSWAVPGAICVRLEVIALFVSCWRKPKAKYRKR